ncbi:MAG: YraN family protein [Chitinispirillales bacterium]|nr:YraN family protein [Chitinispirillales bacterium]
MNTCEKGKQGEGAAAEYLLSKGYTIETRNYRTKHGEIDIIAKSPEGTFVFVEVKAAQNRGCGNPLYRITPAKQKNIIRLAQRYMYERKLHSHPRRVDVISVFMGKIDHIPNAFLA